MFLTLIGESIIIMSFIKYYCTVQDRANGDTVICT